MVAVRAQASISGDLAQSGVIEARNRQSVQLSGEDTTGWESALWMITSYPEGWDEPQGWTLDSSTGFYIYEGIEPPAFMLSEYGAGKWDIDLIVNGTERDSSLRIEVRSPYLGLYDTPYPGSPDRDGFRHFARDINRNWRILDERIRKGTTSTTAFPTIPTDTLVGRDTEGTGAVENISVGGGLEFTGTKSIQRSALEGDVTAPAGSNTTTITNKAVTDAKLRDSAGLSVIGRSSAVAGTPSDIIANTDKMVLRRDGSTLGFGQVDTGGIKDRAVTYGKLPSLAAARLLGRGAGNGEGDVEPIEIGAGLTMIGTTLSATATEPTLRVESFTFDADQHNWNPEGLADADIVRITAQTTTRVITGVAASAFANGRAKLFWNVGSTNVILVNSSGSSDAANRFLLAQTNLSPPDGNSTRLFPNEAVLVWYDTDSQRVRVMTDGLRNIGAGVLVGRTDASSGLEQQITPVAPLQISGQNVEIAENGITDELLRDSAACSVIGRAENSSGDPGDIVADTNDRVLARVDDELQFSQVATAMVEDDAITDAKLRDSAACSVIGRSANSTGNPADIVASTNDRVLARRSDAVSFVQVNTNMIEAGAVGNSKLRDSAGCSVIGRSANTTGVVADITANTNDRVLARTSDALSFVHVSTNMIADGAVTDAKFRDGTACSVVGRSANSTGDTANIQASSNNTVLARVSDALQFTQVATGMLADGAVTFQKFQSINANRLLGRVASDAGPIEEILLDTTLELVGTSAMRRAALTGDVSAAAGSNVTTIANNAVTDAKLRDSAACSVIGRSANSTGDPADIAASTNNTVLARVSNQLQFSQVATDMLADGAVTDAKLRDSAACSVIGRSANSTGDPADIVAGTDGHVLRRAGTTLGFGQIATAGITDGAVTYAKIQNVTPYSILGRQATAGPPQEITATGTSVVLQVDAVEALKFGKITPDLMAPMSEVTVLGRAVGAGTGSPQYLTLAQLRALLGQALPLFAGYPTNGVYASNTAMPITTTAANVGGYTLVGGAVQVPSSGTYEIDFVSERVDISVEGGQARIDLYVGGVLHSRMWGHYEQVGDGSVIVGKTIVNIITPSTERVGLRVPSGFPAVDLTWGLLTIRRIPG